MIRTGLVVLVFAIAPGAQDSGRQVDGQTLRSRSNPDISIRVDTSLRYIGHVAFGVSSGAAAEEYVFGEIKAGRMRRMFVVHFEGYPSSVDDHFAYPRFDMVTLGGNEYLHQAWPEARFDLLENDKLRSLMASRRIGADTAWFVDRFARVVDPESKHEILLFYAEEARTSAVPLSALTVERGGRGGNDKWRAIESVLDAHARTSFAIPHG